jgi:hypothetical protein
LVLILTLAACSGDSYMGDTMNAVPDPFDCNTTFTTAVREFNGGQSPQLEVVSTQDDWCALWVEIYSTAGTGPPCNTGLVDFQTQVALVAATSGPTTCTGIEITCVQRDPDDSLTVVYRVHTPQPGELCGQLYVNPVHVVSVYLPVGLVTFVPDTSTP